jgi:hypothetical protein
MTHCAVNCRYGQQLAALETPLAQKEKLELPPSAIPVGGFASILAQTRPSTLAGRSETTLSPPPPPPPRVDPKPVETTASHSSADNTPVPPVKQESTTPPGTVREGPLGTGSGDVGDTASIRSEKLVTSTSSRSGTPVNQPAGVIRSDSVQSKQHKPKQELQPDRKQHVDEMLRDKTRKLLLSSYSNKPSVKVGAPPPRPSLPEPGGPVVDGPALVSPQPLLPSATGDASVAPDSDPATQPEAPVPVADPGPVVPLPVKPSSSLKISGGFNPMALLRRKK